MKTTIIVVDTNRLDKKIAALNNKLAKRGDTGRIVVLSVTPVEKIVEVSDEDCAPRNVEVPALEVELDIPEDGIKITGFEFVGVIEDLGGATLVTSIKPELAEELEQFRNVGTPCHHCNKDRKRKKVLIFQGPEGFKLIASSCAREYFGIDIESTLSQMLEMSRQSEPFVLKAKDILTQRQFLAACLFFIGREGFKPSAFEDQSTRNKAGSFCYDRDFRKNFPEICAEYKPKSEQLFEDAGKVLPYFQTIENPNPFILNCLAVLTTGNFRKSGILAACANEYFKATDPYTVALNAEKDAAAKQAKEDRVANSVHLGEIGERINVPEATFVQQRIMEGDFGETYIMKFTDPRGSDLTWFASNPPDLTVGDKVTIVGRVKSHGEYMGVRNTVLTRCKIDVLK